MNALREDQRLAVAPAGLTAVYGDNGAGKSAYVRTVVETAKEGDDKPVLVMLRWLTTPPA